MVLFAPLLPLACIADRCLCRHGQVVAFATEPRPEVKKTKATREAVDGFGGGIKPPEMSRRYLSLCLRISLCELAHDGDREHLALVGAIGIVQREDEPGQIQEWP